MLIAGNLAFETTNTRADQQRVSLWKSCRGTKCARTATRGLMDKRNNRGDSADGKSCCKKTNRLGVATQAWAFRPPSRHVYLAGSASLRSKKAAPSRYAVTQSRCSRKSWISSGNTCSSTGTPRARSAFASRTVCANSTLRSSSPWISNTGERHVSNDAIGDEFHANLEAPARSHVNSEDGFHKSTPRLQSCTPCKSTPAANKSEARASASAVRYPP